MSTENKDHKILRSHEYELKTVISKLSDNKTPLKDRPDLEDRMQRVFGGIIANKRQKELSSKRTTAALLTQRDIVLNKLKTETMEDFWAGLNYSPFISDDNSDEITMDDLKTAVFAASKARPHFIDQGLQEQQLQNDLALREQQRKDKLAARDKIMLTEIDVNECAKQLSVLGEVEKILNG